ncbi:TPA: dihydrofolate reductase [Candidatus Woesearchaeota archaeon]|nr:dihydrofolate reductase [archaeon]HIJ10783.1 dihydrofolate reductase [Candidatus Woesearchaeota archaeon]
MISLIVGMTYSHVIGKEGGLPWHLPEDLQNFKKLTSSNVVIMGRKTYDSLPPKYRPLPNRVNIVISRTMEEQEGVVVARSVEDALQKGKEFGKEMFVIGGATIYDQMLSFVDTMYISYVDQEYEGDTFFPKFNKGEFSVQNTQKFSDFTIITYKRKQP